MGTVTDRYNVVYYYPEGLAFSINQGDTGIEISGGVIKMGLYNADGERVGQSKMQFEATQPEKDALISRLTLRRADFEAAEGLTLLPAPE